MIVRDTLIIAHDSLHTAMRRELAARGIVLREGRRWQDGDPGSPERVLGVYTWFYESLRHPLRVWKMRRTLRRLGVPLFAWNQDAPHYLNYTLLRRRWKLELASWMRPFDLYLTHTLVDSKRTFGDSSVYFPNAADTERYHLHGKTLAELRSQPYDYDVSFFGAMDGVRYKEMRPRQEFFAALGDRLRAKGIRFLFREASDMSPAEQADLIQRTRINLNYGASCEYGAPVASGLPERCYGIPACGGFLLCDKRTHARDDFTPGENWAEFDGLDDCVAKIEYWLANFAAARTLAERCHAHVMARHTYAHRAESLYRLLLAWHANRTGLIA